MQGKSVGISGRVFIVSAPSGAGKTSLVHALLERDDGIDISISHTTRARRAGEVDGKHYHFIDRIAFERMVVEGEFLEHAQVFDNFYGTAQDALLDQVASGRDVIVEIDWQGAAQVRKAIPEAISIFILPPSRKALESRLRGRGQDDDSVISRRMRDAESEMSHYAEFDYLIVNDDFEVALGQLSAVVQASRFEIGVQKVRHAELTKELLATG